MFTSSCRLQLSIRIVGSRVLDHCDVVAKLGGKPNCCLHTGVCDEARHDKLVNAVLLELQIQISIGEPTEQRQSEHRIGRFLLAIVQSEPKLQARHWGAGCV
jgi:hypothetical protein